MSNAFHRVCRPKKDYFRELLEGAWRKWETRWLSETTCRQTRLMVPERNPILTRFLFTQTRVNASLLTQFITGHNYLNYHRSLIDRTIDKTCRLCLDGIEDSWHLLSRCDALAFKRLETFLDDNIKKLPHPRLALQFIRNTRIVKLMEPPVEN